MDDRQWMYTGWRSQSDYTTEWMNKTDAFLNSAFGNAAKGHCLVSSSNPLVSRWYREFLRQSWHGSRQPTPQENDTLLSQGAGPESLDFICWFKQKAQTDARISDELRQVANGYAVRVKSFTDL